MDQNAYAYIVGRLRALETRLLDTNAVERMLDASSAEEAFKVLNDLSFITSGSGESAMADFQAILTNSLKGMLDLISQMSPYPEVLNFLNLKFDFHNLKIALKARLNQHGYADIKHALINLGSLDANIWETFVLEGKIPPLTDGMHQTMNDASKKFEETQDPQIVDLLVDKHYLQEMLNLTGTLGSNITMNYVKKLIDFVNLKSFIRCKELNKEKSYFESVILKCGYIPCDNFISNYKKNYEELKNILEKKMYSDDLVKVLSEFLLTKSLLPVEKKISTLLQEYMKKSNGIPFGPEPVFAFFWKFENHLQILRTILIGKLNQLPTEEIRENVLTI